MFDHPTLQTLAEQHDANVDWWKGTKLSHVTDPDTKSTDMDLWPRVVIHSHYDNEIPVSFMLFVDLDPALRSPLAQAMQIGRKLLDGYRISLFSEGYSLVIPGAEDFDWLSPGGQREAERKSDEAHRQIVEDHGSLSGAWMAGQEGVDEVLNIMDMSETGEQLHSSIPYKIRGSVIEWGDSTPDAMATGSLKESMSFAFVDFGEREETMLNTFRAQLQESIDQFSISHLQKDILKLDSACLLWTNVVQMLQTCPAVEYVGVFTDSEDIADSMVKVAGASAFMMDDEGNVHEKGPDGQQN